MRRNKSDQLSALLACRSHADLSRLREMDSPSFPFITLACKYNRPDLLNLLLEDDTSDGAVVVPRWCSVEQEYEGHGAVYYAIRSSNVELFRTLLRSVTTELSERLVSESFEELLLINVHISEEMHHFVQCKLLELRFFSKGDGAFPDTSVADIQERVQLLLENIGQVNTYTEVDSHFLYTAKFIAQNIYILKNLLKSTYNILPWEEMEFCLVSFISAHIRRQELNLFYLSVLKKERLLKELVKFSSALQELEEHIRSTDVKKLRNSVRRNREDVVAAIINRYSHLYADYKEVRDASSLHIMKTYLDAALLADSASRLGQLTIKRALQVTGEHLKNTLDSPKLSPTVSDLLLLSAPKETREVLRDLRNSLSHPHLESEDSVLYSNIQNDIKKIASVIIDITNAKKVDKLKSMLTTLVNSENIDELHEVSNFFRNFCIEDAQETDTITKYHQELEDLIRNIEDQTPYEKKLVTEINDALDQSNLHLGLTKEDCINFNELGSLLTYNYGHNTKTDDNVISSMKQLAQSTLKNFQSQKSSKEIKGQHFSLGDLLLKLYKSISFRNNQEIAFGLEFAMLRLAFTVDKSDIKCIDDYRRQTFLEKSNIKENGGKKCKSVKNSTEIIGEQLTLKITELRNFIGTDRMCGQLYEHLSLLYKDKNTNRFMVEALVLDIMSLLDSSKCVPNNVLYLDGDTPLLSGKCLRNHLAHENALLDILPTDVWSAVLLNAVKLTESKDLLLNCKIGNVLKHNVTQLRQRYKRGLCILDKRKEMWKSLLDGNFNDFALGIAEGADIHSRNRDLSSTLHYAARGPNIETVKFLTKQKLINTEVKDIDGQTATHVAATFGRDVTVKFLVAEFGNAINQIDGFGWTPLHLASKNGHKKTVMTLLSLGAETHIKDSSGRSPLHTAVMFNNLDVVKILSVNETALDEKTIDGVTPLHIATDLGNMEIIKYFLLKGADVNAKSDLGYSTLFGAASKGHQEVVNALLEKGAHVNLRDTKGLSPLFCAVINNHKEIIRMLLEKGAFINIRDVENNTPFHFAVFTGDIFVVGLLLQHNANVNAKRKDGRTPLLVAAAGGHADIVDLLLQNGALADSIDVTGSTALHIAAHFGHTSVVENLIRRGIDLHTQNIYQTTALHVAAKQGHQQVVDILLVAGANLLSVDEEGWTALHLSARNGHIAISEALIMKGANVNCKNSRNITPLHVAAMKTCNEKTIQLLLKYRAVVNEKIEDGRTALHIASFVGNSSVVEALLKGKADVDAKYNGGKNALHLAVSGNHKATVEILLNYGASINLLDSKGASVLCIAARNNNKDLLDLLIAKGADINFGEGQLLLTAIYAGHRRIVEALLKIKDVDINIKDRDGSKFLYAAAVSGDSLIARELIKRGIKVADCLQNPSPLFMAMSLGHTEFVEVLLASGTNINPVDPNLSPLYHAIQVNKPEVMERLLHWGANSNIRDSKNRTPLEMAVGNAQTHNTLILLQQEGVRINERGTDNWTLLHIAAQAGNLEITKLLVDRGADVNARNKQDYKPIHIAAMHGNHNILALFLELGMCIDDPGPAGCSLMHCAAGGGQLAVTQYLIDKHVDINSTDLNGSMPIHCSTELGHTEMVKFLLHNGAVYDAKNKFGRVPSDLTKSRDIEEVLESIGKLFKAVKKNNVSMVQILVKDLEKYINAKSSDNATLLHIASWKGFQEICDILLESKANPNAVGKGGNTPLHFASKYSHTGIVQSLLKNGAAHNLKADNMKTPLDFATQKDIESVLQIIALCFNKVLTQDVEVIKDITKIRDIEIIKAVMRARDADGNTLAVVAMKYDFPKIDQLKQVSQTNIPDISSKVSSLLEHEELTKALGILKKQLRDRIEILGEDNPGTLDLQYDIARILLDQSKYFEALSMLEDIYRKRVETFGPHHLDSLQTRSTMALLLHYLGRNKEAWDIFQEIMPRLLEILGEEHYILLSTKAKAGVMLSALGKHEEALCLHMEVYQRYKNTLGAHQPHTLHQQNNIAAVLHAQGKPHEAFALYQTIYEARKIIQGLNHSETLKVRCNMANVLLHQRKLDEALQILQETLAIQNIVLGLNHGDTIRTQMLITRLYIRQKKMCDAVKVHKAGLNARKAVFGPNHPHFTKLDKDIEIIEKRFKTIFGRVLGYVAPCDINLLNASSEGDRGKICNLIENGSDVNTVDVEGRTALHFATTVEVVKLLLDSGADATAVSQKGNTPLHEATSRACIQTVRLLLQRVKKIKPNAYRDFINAKTAVEGSTALHVAAKTGAADIVSCLLEHGACYNSRDRSNNCTPLQCSSSPSVTELLRLAEEVFDMAERGGTVLPQGDERHLVVVMNSRDTEHRTPLQLAEVNSHTATASILAGFLETLD